MRRMNGTVLFLLLVWAKLWSGVVGRRVLTVGISAETRAEFPLLVPTFQALNLTLAEHGIVLAQPQWMSIANFEYYSYDMFFTGAVIRVCLELYTHKGDPWANKYWEQPIEPIVNVINAPRTDLGFTAPTMLQCCIMVVRNDSDIQTPRDFVNKRVTMAHPLASNGGRKELAEALDRYQVDVLVQAAELRLMVFYLNEIVYDILNGTSDVAFIKADWLHVMIQRGDLTQAQFDQLRIINVRSEPNEFYPYRCSTGYEDDGAVYVSSNVTLEERDLISQGFVELMSNATLKSMLTTSRVAGWAPPISASSIFDSLFRIRAVVDKGSGYICPPLTQLYEIVNCPSGYYKLPPNLFYTTCQRQNRTCPSFAVCLCEPCRAIPSERFAVMMLAISDSSVSLSTIDQQILALEYSLTDSSTITEDHNLFSMNRTLHSCAKLGTCVSVETNQRAVVVVVDLLSPVVEQLGLLPTVSVQISVSSSPYVAMESVSNVTWRMVLEADVIGSALIDVIPNSQLASQSPFLYETTRVHCSDGSFADTQSLCPTPRSSNLLLAIVLPIVLTLALVSALVGLMYWRFHSSRRGKIPNAEIELDVSPNDANDVLLTGWYRKRRIRLVVVSLLNHQPYVPSSVFGKEKQSESGALRAPRSSFFGPRVSNGFRDRKSFSTSVRSMLQHVRSFKGPSDSSGSMAVESPGALVPLRAERMDDSELVKGAEVGVSTGSVSSAPGDPVHASKGRAEVGGTGDQAPNSPLSSLLLLQHVSTKGFTSSSSLLRSPSRIESSVQRPVHTRSARTIVTVTAPESRSKEETIVEQVLSQDQSPTASDTSTRRLLSDVSRLVREGHHKNLAVVYGYTWLPIKQRMSNAVVKELCIVEEFSELGTLATLLDSGVVDAMDVVDRLRIARDVSSGMWFLHGGDRPLPHGRLSPSSVILDEGLRAKVAWRGGMKDSAASGSSSSGALSALEFALKEDVKAFGVLLVTLFFSPEDAALLLTTLLRSYSGFMEVIGERSEVPIKVRDMITDCCRLASSDRPSFDALHTALQREYEFSARQGKNRAASLSLDATVAKLFPPEMVETIRKGERVEPVFYPDVAVLFSDVVDFTSISSVVNPLELQRVLNGMFSAFDALIDSLRLFRVDIIGDAYIAVSNLTVKHERDYVSLLVQFASEMQRIAKSWRFVTDDGRPLDVRIRVGIHVGPVVATVFGVDRPRFSLVGDTMNVASRMEQSSLPGRIHLSGAAALLLKEQAPELSPGLEPRGELEIKGKGRMQTFFYLPPRVGVLKGLKV